MTGHAYTEFKKRGFKMRLMTWRALSISPYRTDWCYVSKECPYSQRSWSEAELWWTWKSCDTPPVGPGLPCIGSERERTSTFLLNPRVFTNS